MNPGNLTPWEPGQSGNSVGGSRTVRERMLLRELLAEKLGEKLPPAIQNKLAALSDEDREHAEEQIAGLTYGDLISTRIAISAAVGNPTESAKSIDQILSGEPKQFKVDVTASAAVAINTEPKRLDEVSEILDEA